MKFQEQTWFLVRRVYSSKRWHRATDDALGTQSYGNYVPEAADTSSNHDFSVKYSQMKWNKIMFSQGAFPDEGGYHSVFGRQGFSKWMSISEMDCKSSSASCNVLRKDNYYLTTKDPVVGTCASDKCGDSSWELETPASGLSCNLMSSDTNIRCDTGGVPNNGLISNARCEDHSDFCECANSIEQGTLVEDCTSGGPEYSSKCMVNG